MCASFNVSRVTRQSINLPLVLKAYKVSKLLRRTFQSYLRPSFNIDGAYKLLIIIVSYLNMSMVQVTNQTNLMELETHSGFTLI